MQDDFMDPQLAADIEISRHELAEGKGIPHEVVFAELDRKLRELKAKQDQQARLGAIPECAAPAPTR